MKYCYRCGRSMGDDFGFCPACGTTSADLNRPVPAAPVYTAEPVAPASVGGRVMAGLSKGLGIAALVLSIFTSVMIFAEVEVEALLFFFVLTSMFSVPALLLSIFAQKQGVSVLKGRIFGIIGCSICLLSLMVMLASL